MKPIMQRAVGLAAGAAFACAATMAAAADLSGAGATFPVSDLCQMGGGL